MSIQYKGKPCGPIKSSKNPDAYTKEELVSLAVKKLKIEESKANSMTKSTICKSLVAGKVTERTTPVKKRAKTVATKTKTPAATKKTVTKKASPVTKKTVTKKTVTKKASPVKKVPKVKVTPKTPSPKVPKPKVKVTPKKPCVEQSKLPLREHQIRVVNHIRKNRGLIVCHDVGSGKTLTAVTAGQCFLEDCKSQNKKGKIIVVTPVSLQDNFKKEMNAYGVGKNDMKLYEFYTLQKFATEYNKKSCSGNSKTSVMLIIDEAHNLRTDVKSAKSAAKSRAASGKSKKAPVVRADVAIRCAKTADKVLLLTATSVYNEPRDLANLVAMVKGTEPLTKKEFAKMLLDENAFKKFFSCTLSFYDVPKDTDDYPTVDENYVEIPMSKKYYEEYRKVEQRNSHLFSESNPWRFLTGVRQASNALEKCEKCDWVLNLALSGEKMVIYSAFKTFGVEKIQGMFKEQNIPYVEITGAIKKSARTEAVEKYNSGEANVLFITKAGGEGLDLKETRKVIIFESSWNRASEAQVIGRAVRFRSHSKLPKSERHVDVFHLLMVKPHNRELGDKYESADSMLKEITDQKEKVNDFFIKRVFPLSIEQLKGC
jgi:SNF2 family DNA or RNA helicase